VHIVLLHGFSDSGRCWSSWLSFFGRFAHVSTPNARGHGGAPLPDEPFGAAQHLADLIPHLDRPSVLVGHSMGAVTAALAAAKHPELVRAVVLEDPPWRPDDAEWDPSPYREWITRMQATPLTEREAQCHAENPNWSEHEVAPWAESKGQVDPAIFDRPIEWLSEPWRDTAAAIAVPALLLTGDPELGGIIGAYDASWVAANTSVEVVTIEGAGHSIRRDRPARYRALVAGFLERLEP
jgi:pimeloyl-ACP methyl ester carboxylesterase